MAWKGNTTQFEKCIEATRKDADKIISKTKHRIMDRINVTNTNMISKLVYQSRNSSFDNRQLKVIDGIVSTMYRKVCRLNPVFPTALIYMNKKLGGLGQQRISDKTNNDKLANMNRIVATKSLTRNHLMCMLMRACKVRGIENKPGHRASITGLEKTTQPEWLDSVIQSAAEVNIALTLGGRNVTLDDTDWPETRLPENDDKTSNPLKQNWAEGKHFYSDIITKNNKEWIASPTREAIPSLPLDYKHVLRHEQAYLHEEPNQIFEILGRWDNSLDPYLETRI